MMQSCVVYMRARNTHAHARTHTHARAHTRRCCNLLVPSMHT